MKKRFIAIAVLAILLCSLLAGCSSWNRDMKSIASDFSGGIDRTVTVYDYSGNEIKSWSGRFDMSESENEVFFDLNGKRVIIHGGIVIAEEN